MDELWLIGRILFGALFVGAGIGMLLDLPGSTKYAETRGVAQAQAGVVLASVAFLLGGASIILGIWGDLGALLLIVTLIPVTFLMNMFWAERDPEAKQVDQGVLWCCFRSSPGTPSGSGSRTRSPMAPSVSAR